MEGRKRLQRRGHSPLVPDSLHRQLQYRRARHRQEPDSLSIQVPCRRVRDGSQQEPGSLFR
nr:hypothetical protein [uncultured Acetatifactor sp.]